MVSSFRKTWKAVFKQPTRQKNSGRKTKTRRNLWCGVTWEPVTATWEFTRLLKYPKITIISQGLGIFGTFHLMFWNYFISYHKTSLILVQIVHKNNTLKHNIYRWLIVDCFGFYALSAIFQPYKRLKSIGNISAI